MRCTGELTECCSQLYFKNKQVHRKRDRICPYWRYAEGCWEGNWKNLVKGYKLPEHHPAGSGGRPLPPNTDLEGALGPKHSLRALHRPTSAESRKHRGAPGEPSSRRRLAGPCPGASSRPWARRKHALLQVIRALQKGTRLLLRKTPFCRLQLSQPTSLPSLPLPRETVSSSPTAETRRARPLSLSSLELTSATS